MGFPGYFLIVSDFIKWAKAQKIPVGPGRGSGAGSLVAWSLTITDVDPIRFNLIFERFLNPERVSMPDFDIDFCQDRRDEVIEYVKNRYGSDRVAQIITFGKLQARAVLRDVGRVLQMSYGQVDKLCKLVPNNPANPCTLEEALEQEPQLKRERDTDQTVRRLIDISLKLEGLYRHASTHAAGVIIGDRPLDELIPIYRDPKSDMPITQFSMKYVEMAGLVKFDFLGLKTLTILETAAQMARDRGSDVYIEDIPLDDTKTFELLRSIQTAGVFQLESQGMRDVLASSSPIVLKKSSPLWLCTVQVLWTISRAIFPVSTGTRKCSTCMKALVSHGTPVWFTRNRSCRSLKSCQAIPLGSGPTACHGLKIKSRWMRNARFLWKAPVRTTWMANWPTRFSIRWPSSRAMDLTNPTRRLTA